MVLVLKLFTILDTPAKYAVIFSKLISLIIFLLVLWFVGYLCRLVSEKYIIDKIFKGRFEKWHAALRAGNFFAAVGYLAAGLIIGTFISFFFPEQYTKFSALGAKLLNAYIQICILIMINKVLTIITHFYGNNPNMPVKGLIQALKILINFFGILIIVASFFGKEPMFFIASLGVIASVLMLVFKDPILGLTASFQLSMNDMLRIGDWVEVPQHGADGDVIDISLTTVRVQNWDKTIVSVPAYDLISSSFKNWRGMSESGGRRIKRAINIDLQTIKFVDAEMLKRLKKIELLSDYLESKEKEILEYNSHHNVTEAIINGRNLTNIGTFRAYCAAYIQSRDYIHKKFTAMVRQLEPGPQGLPLEIYCFTNTVVWVDYEIYQSDLFDHLLSAMKDFDLRPFQNPSSADISSLAAKTTLKI
ncbi:MAG: mechanosensitive ion channel family protein [Elusimicrobia bacterium]|nr:mechanosensitive ion channel family protein [Elusimicrobiota bacterium]